MIHAIPRPRGYQATPEGILVPDRRGGNVCCLGHGHGHGHGLHKPSGGIWTPDEWGADRLLDYVADDVVLSGTRITTWNNQVAGGPNATQATSTAWALYTAAHPSMNGQPAGTFEGNDYYAVALVAANTSHTFAYAGQIDGSNFKFWFDTSAGRIAMYNRYNNKWGMYDGSYRTSAIDTPIGYLSFMWTLDAGSGTQSVYLSTGLVATMAYTPRSIGGDVKFGAQFNGTQANTGAVGRFVLLNRVSVPDDRLNWFGYTMWKYGF